MKPLRKGNAGAPISFTVFVSPGRLSKEYRLRADGSVERVSGTQFAQGDYRVVSFAASDPSEALAKVGRTIDALSSQEAISLGVPTDGTTAGRITTKERFVQGGPGIPRALSHFAWPEGHGLLLLDGDDIDGLYELLCELYPPFAKIAFLSRPSASASVIDPSSGKALKRGEHGYVLIDDPLKSKECLEALMRLAWCHGTGEAAGRLQLSKSGSVLVRGPVDVSVGSPERLSYEGAAIVGPRLKTLPRTAVVMGGNGILIAAELIAFADQVAPASLFAERCQSAADDPEFRVQRDGVRAKHRAEHVRAAEARGTSRRKAEADYDRVTAMGVTSVGRWSFVPLTPDHRLWLPDGRPFTVADIQKNPVAFRDTECADPVEGLDYQSRNCAIIYTDGPCIKIYSRAHGDTFAYFAPLAADEPWEEVLRGLGEARLSGAPTPSEGTVATAEEAWVLTMPSFRELCVKRPPSAHG